MKENKRSYSARAFLISLGKVGDNLSCTIKLSRKKKAARIENFVAASFRSVFFCL